MKNLTIILIVLVMASGCSAFRSYKTEQKPVIESLSVGHVDEAVAKLEETATKEKDLLFYMEKGELQRLKKTFNDSVGTWTNADQMIDQWESGAKITAGKVGEALGSVVINDKVRNYDGEDYEKVMLSTRQALNYLALGKMDDAMVEMKKTWERESLIRDLHDKDIQASEIEAKNKGYTTKSEDLKGYPIATLNSPDVLVLKNGYQSAFSQYLSGFLSEATGDIGNAAAGYRTAIELQPSLQSLKKHLADLDSRIAYNGRVSKVSQGSDEGFDKHARRSGRSKKYGRHGGRNREHSPLETVASAKSTQQNMIGADTDVLIVVENGLAPDKTGVIIPLPIPSVGLLPISFPVIETDPLSKVRALSVTLPNNTTENLEIITSIEAMARRSLKDSLPYIMVRAAIRAAIKGTAQAAAYKQNALAGLAVNIVNIATEQADERIWKTLPSDITIARVRLPEGNHTLKIKTTDGERSVDVSVSGKYCVIPIRIIGGGTYVMQNKP